MPLVLHKSDRSPLSRAVLMTIELIKAQVDLKNVDPLTKETQKPEFLTKNPLHTVPVLEDDDLVITDSHAIVTYLVSKYGGEKSEELYPKDLKSRAIVDQRLYYDATILWPRFLNPMVAVHRHNLPEVPKEHIEGIEEVYRVLETYLEKSDFLASDHITIADISIVASVSTLDIFVSIDNTYPRVVEWFNRMKQHDWYVKGNEGLSEIRRMVDGKLKR